MYNAIWAVNSKSNYTMVLLDRNEPSNLQNQEVNISVFHLNLWWSVLYSPV